MNVTALIAALGYLLVILLMVAVPIYLLVEYTNP